MNNQSGSVVKEVFTSSNGSFTITNLLSGNYTAEVTSDNTITSYFNFVCIGGQTTNRGDVPVSPRLSNSEIRIVLSWGLDPRDLDSHLTGNGIHVYYSNKNAQGINLDVDDVSGYGPETITIDLGRAPKGKYSYYVHHFSGTGTLGTSGANVKVYSGNLLIKEFNVPGSISERYWYVFEIDTENGLIEGIAAASPQTQLMRTRAVTDNFTEDEVSDEFKLLQEDIEKNKKME